MPFLTICKYPGCRKPVPLGAKYCEAHKAAGEARDAKFSVDRERRRTERTGSSAARGYGYKWQRIRARILARIRYVLSVRSAGLSSWRPTSTTSGRTRGILSSCGTKTTFSRSATSVTLERRQERMEALGTMCSRKKIMGRMLVVVERAESCGTPLVMKLN